MNNRLYKVLVIAILAAIPSMTSTAYAEYVENQEITLDFSFGTRTGVYTGNLKDGLPDGVGKFSSINPNGESWAYVGEWDNGHFSSQGSAIWYANATIQSGIYENDYLTNGVEGVLRSDLDNYEMETQIADEEVSGDAESFYEASESDFDYVNNGSAVQINGYKGKGGNIIIPDNIEGTPVTRIANGAFKDARHITGIKLPNNLEIIGEEAFMGLDNLKGAIVFPATVTDIEHHAFQNTSISGIVIQSDCNVGVAAFRYLQNLSFIFVKAGTSPNIQLSAFTESAVTTAILPQSVSEIDDESFESCNQMVIYAPSGSYGEIYANKNFFKVNTSDYESIYKKYAEEYEIPLS